VDILVLANGIWIIWPVVISPVGNYQSQLPTHNVVFSFLLVTGTRKFAQAYMLARELGSGAFSVVKLGVNLVSENSTS